MIRAWLSWALGACGYWVRPYDMLADARRWRWQPRTPCQHGGFVIEEPAERKRMAEWMVGHD